MYNACYNIWINSCYFLPMFFIYVKNPTRREKWLFRDEILFVVGTWETFFEKINHFYGDLILKLRCDASMIICKMYKTAGNGVIVIYFLDSKNYLSLQDYSIYHKIVVFRYWNVWILFLPAQNCVNFNQFTYHYWVYWKTSNILTRV